MDNLERFIRENKEQFDTRNPDPGVWNAIEQKLPQRTSRQIVMWRWVAAAAVALLLIMSGVVVGTQMERGASSEYAAQYEEFKQAEQFYRIQLDEKVQALNQYAHDTNVESDLKELESLYNELSGELEDGLHPNQNDIIQALIQNYQTRIDLLERVLNRLEESEEQQQLIEEDNENIKL